MFHEIEPHQFHNQYEPRQPQPEDYVLVYKENQVILINENDALTLPQHRQLNELLRLSPEPLIYLLSIDDRSIYLTWQETVDIRHGAYYGIMNFRSMQPDWLAFSGATAFHLASWYHANRFCGRCSARMQHKADERAMLCPACGQLVYPRISPVVMVGVKDGEKLLLTKYARSHATYRRHALIAGFMEIGETPEEAVSREVMEEVGLKVRNIRYYKSQPWAFSESLLLGFFADVDGSNEIMLDEKELSEAEWIPGQELEQEDSVLSLTWDMIHAFRLGSV